MRSLEVAFSSGLDVKSFLFCNADWVRFDDWHEFYYLF